MGRKIISMNRKAYHEFTIFEKYIAGIVLTGTEIKSVRKNAVNLKDSFAKIEDGEVFLFGCHISPYEQGNRYNHKPDRIRKLLLNKKEILKIHTKMKKDGYTIIPLSMFLSDGFALYKRSHCSNFPNTLLFFFSTKKAPILFDAYCICLV